MLRDTDYKLHTSDRSSSLEARAVIQALENESSLSLDTTEKFKFWLGINQHEINNIRRKVNEGNN